MKAKPLIDTFAAFDTEEMGLFDNPVLMDLPNDFEELVTSAAQRIIEAGRKTRKEAELEMTNSS